MVETDNGMQLDLFDVLYKDFKFDKNKPVRLIETFAGIGTQRMGFERAGIDVDVIAIVEVDKHAVLSYASMHTDYLKVRDTWFNDKDITKDTMVEVLQNKMLGYDFKNSKHTITERNNIEIVRDFYLADHLSKNLGDISKVKGVDLPQGIDILTYSFPCTDLSKAGQQKGLTDTRSGLVYQVFRIVEELKELNNAPKTLLMENVIDLIQSKFINEFNEMQLELEDKEYINYNFVMNAKDFGVAQNRDRVFMLSIPRNHNYTEPKPFKLVKRLKDYLEDDVDESYYLSDDLLKHIEETGSKTTNYIKYDRYKGSFASLCRVWFGLSPTIHTKSNEIKVIENDDSVNLRIRKLTPLECWRLMGIDEIYHERAVLVSSSAQLYKQAGNAIVVDVFAEIVRGMM